MRKKLIFGSLFGLLAIPLSSLGCTLVNNHPSKNLQQHNDKQKSSLNDYDDDKSKKRVKELLDQGEAILENQNFIKNDKLSPLILKKRDLATYVDIYDGHSDALDEIEKDLGINLPYDFDFPSTISDWAYEYEYIAIKSWIIEPSFDDQGNPLLIKMLIDPYTGKQIKESDWVEKNPDKNYADYGYFAWETWLVNSKVTLEAKKGSFIQERKFEYEILGYNTNVNYDIWHEAFDENLESGSNWIDNYRQIWRDNKDKPEYIRKETQPAYFVFPDRANRFDFMHPPILTNNIFEGNKNLVEMKLDKEQYLFLPDDQNIEGLMEISQDYDYRLEDKYLLSNLFKLPKDLSFMNAWVFANMEMPQNFTIEQDVEFYASAFRWARLNEGFTIKAGSKILENIWEAYYYSDVDKEVWKGNKNKYYDTNWIWEQELWEFDKTMMHWEDEEGNLISDIAEVLAEPITVNTAFNIYPHDLEFVDIANKYEFTKTIKLVKN